MPSGFFQTLKKTIRLNRISKKLARPLDISGYTQFSLAEFRSQQDLYLNRLIAIARSDQYVQYVIDQFKADDAALKKIYDLLVSAGAGKYVAGHYVAASSLAYPLPLTFLLRHFDGIHLRVNHLDRHGSASLISNSLVTYFENREKGEVCFLIDGYNYPIATEP